MPSMHIACLCSGQTGRINLFPNVKYTDFNMHLGRSLKGSHVMPSFGITQNCLSVFGLLHLSLKHQVP